MIILGIETSCDETSVAVISANPKKITVLSSVVSSQIKLHAKWGGVVPHLASREHAKNIDWVLATALKESGVKLKDVDLIAVTSGPGLIVSLIIGTTFAKALAWRNNIPIIGVNHMEGHIYSNWLLPVRVDRYQPPAPPQAIPLTANRGGGLEAGQATGNQLLDAFPALCLVVSGGHTQLILMSDHGKYKLIGETLDDAAGEAFDKIARIIGLGYPGGPAISKYAEKGNPLAYPLPRPMLKSKNYNFSFSGLKTAVLYLARELQTNNYKLTTKSRRDVAASAQEAIVDVLVTKTIRAAQQYKVRSIMLSGGVSANKLLRERLVKSSNSLTPRPYTLIPSLVYTTDNAAMIALAGYYNWTQKNPSTRLRTNKKARNSWQTISADANWEIF